MNILQVVVVIIELTFLGIFVAFNPLLLVSELAIILKSKRPLLNSIILIAGVATPLIIIAIVGGFVFNENTQVRSFSHDIRLSPILNIIFGVILVLVGLRLRFFPKTSNPKKLDSVNMSGISLFWFAFFRSALSFTSIIGIVAATKIIKDMTDNYLVVLLGLFWTICVGMIPFLGMIGYSIKRPETIKNIEERIDPLMNRSYKPILIWGCLILGFYLLSLGILKIYR